MMNAHRIDILEVSRDQAHSVAKWIAPLFDAYRRFYRKPPDLAGAEDWLSRRISASEASVFIGVAPDALADGADCLTQSRDGVRAAGFALLYPGFTSVGFSTRWTLNDLYVDPAFRRHGIGRLLTLRAMLLVESEGSAAIQLLTEHTNTSAQALYADLGWTRDQDYQRWTWKPPGA